MSIKLIIVTDLQRFKLFAIKVDPMGRESVELVQSIDSLETHERLRDKVSDRKGNFQGVGASGSGENHNLEEEEEHRRIKEIAAQISRSLQEYRYDSWYFSAPKAINNQIVELIDPAIKSTMTINLHADVTKIPDDQLLEYFTK
ncbi:MAG: host attachment protein [Sulfuricurvum sp.]|uniref:host attachment protein n=1 Tax=Sulfuricurvum sp. TaxID=2025608 RepID=UPI00262C6B81|nr:host attachment protein [Sulfuricurvum sp.]MDD2950566.1 host attachment protein [Sulfuricurvum sp.]MDD5117651.1 host attachment protein [Sulfuricurvum sp.]